MKYLDLFVQGDLKVPLDIITQKVAILARTGAGKSTAAAAIVEEVLAAKQQVVILDPKGDWWGLRADAEGGVDGAAFPIPVFGGSSIAKTFDMDASAGALFADTAAEGASMVLDLSEFSNAERNRFVTDFAERFYRAKAQHADPVLLVLEEADEMVPQRFGGEQARMVGAVERIVKRGRFRGIGPLLITQRSASLNKDVLTQIEVLIVMQTTSPQDRKAIDSWVENHPDEEKVTELSKGMAALKQGEAYIWSPSWLDTFERVKFRRRRTYDAGRTPGIGERRREPKFLSNIDIEKLGARMNAMVEKAKANDPEALKRRIRELEASAKTAPKNPATPKRVEVPVKVVTAAQIGRLEKIVKRAESAIAVISRAGMDWSQGAKELRDASIPIAAELEWIRTYAAPSGARSASVPGHLGRQATPASEIAGADRGPVRAAAPAANLPTGHRPSAGDRRVDGRSGVERAARSGEPRAPSSLGKGERKVLAAIAMHDGGVTRDQLTVLTGYKRSSRDTYIQRLTSAGMAELNGGGTIIATDTGIAELGHDYEQLPTGAALGEYWLERLTGGEAMILAYLMGQYPGAVSRDDISENTEYKRSSRDTYLQRLISRKLVTAIGRGEVKASPALFG